MENRTNKDLEQRGAENQLEGTGKDLKGRAKDAAGGLTGDSEMQAEGKWDRLKGKAQEKTGDLQQRIGRDTNEREQI